ncbi:MAG: nucleoside hydrolase [Candidatus Lokiarchaeota archaeon]|nr:nucleoside hydrolase [Candidatus Lokiarchaeota archaeon]
MDTDIGTDIDDSWALGLLLKSTHELDFKLVTTATQDTPYRAKIVARMLEIAGRTDVSIGIGPRTSDKAGPQNPWVLDYDLTSYPGTLREDGVAALVDAIMSSDGQITLVTIGPLTNVALALKQEPRIASKARVVAMLGSIRAGYGGQPVPVPEYNVVQDVAACEAVLTAPWEVTLAPLDTCGTVVLDGERYAALTRSTDPIVEAVIENYETWNFARGQTTRPVKSSVLFDTVAVYLAIAGGLANVERVEIAVDDSGRTREVTGGKACRCATSWRDFGAFLDWLVARLLA